MGGSTFDAAQLALDVLSLIAVLLLWVVARRILPAGLALLARYLGAWFKRRAFASEAACCGCCDDGPGPVGARLVWRFAQRDDDGFGGRHADLVDVEVDTACWRSCAASKRTMPTKGRRCGRESS